MSVEVYIPTPFRRATNNKDKVSAHLQANQDLEEVSAHPQANQGSEEASDNHLLGKDWKKDKAVIEGMRLSTHYPVDRPRRMYLPRETAGA